MAKKLEIIVIYAKKMCKYLLAGSFISIYEENSTDEVVSRKRDAMEVALKNEHIYKILR